jgi:hypothetical protein
MLSGLYACSTLLSERLHTAKLKRSPAITFLANSHRSSPPCSPPPMPSTAPGQWCPAGTSAHCATPRGGPNNAISAVVHCISSPPQAPLEWRSCLLLRSLHTGSPVGTQRWFMQQVRCASLHTAPQHRQPWKHMKPMWWMKGTYTRRHCGHVMRQCNFGFATYNNTV